MKSSARSLTLPALMTALTALLSPVAVPVGPGALTLQTFLIALTGYTLRPGQAFLSALAYLALGACGLPVFSMMQGGAGMLAGPTGGFLLGFPIMAALCSLGKSRPPLRPAAGLAGLLVVYILGTVQMSRAAGLTLIQAALTGAVPFLVKDVLSILAADRLSRTIMKRLCRRG